MISGIGVDSVEIRRFAHWLTYPEDRLKKILSPQEITYCKAIPRLCAQRFAARFAAREAFFKAWVSAFPDRYIPFLTLCKAITVIHGRYQEPQIAINWPSLGFKDSQATALVSLTHTDTTATVIVAIQKNSM